MTRYRFRPCDSREWFFFFFNDTATTEIYTLSLHDALPIWRAFYPRRGYVLTLQGGGAAEALLSDTSFIRLYGRHTQYFRAGDNGRLILRSEVGSVLAQTRGGIPPEFLFRAGGA